MPLPLTAVIATSIARRAIIDSPPEPPEPEPDVTTSTKPPTAPVLVGEGCGVTVGQQTVTVGDGVGEGVGLGVGLFVGTGVGLFVGTGVGHGPAGAGAVSQGV
jgi:hypothetical protein